MEKFITKHTPGPWAHIEYACGVLKSKDENTGTEWEHTAFRIRHGDDTGKIIGEASYSTANVGNGWVNRYDEAEANAKLMAAAPLLIDALLNILDYPTDDLIGWSTGIQPITITLTPWHINKGLSAIAAAGVVVEESKETTE